MLKTYLELADLIRMARFGVLLDGAANKRDRRRKYLHLGRAFSVGTASAVTGVKTTHTVTGQVTGTAPISGGNAPTVDIGYSGANKSFTFGTGSAGTINQAIEVIFTAVKNTTTALDMTGVLTNVLNDLLSTCTVVREMWIEYLTSTQDATNGSNVAASATVSIVPSGSNPWINSPLGADGKIYCKPGEKIILQNNDATGWAVTADTGDKLDFVHPSNTFDAKFRITIFAEK